MYNIFGSDRLAHEKPTTLLQQCQPFPIASDSYNDIQIRKDPQAPLHSFLRQEIDVRRLTSNTAILRLGAVVDKDCSKKLNGIQKQYLSEVVNSR